MNSYFLIYEKHSDKNNIRYGICYANQFQDFFDFDQYIISGDFYTKPGLNTNLISENKDINLYLRTLKKEFGGIIKVSNFKDKKFYHTRLPDKLNGKKLTIKLSECKGRNLDEKKFYYKVLCTYIRYLYEHPYRNYLLRAIKRYREDKSIHLFTYLYAMHKNKMFNSGHSILNYSNNRPNSFFHFKEVELNNHNYNSGSQVQSLANEHANDVNNIILDEKILNKLK